MGGNTKIGLTTHTINDGKKRNMSFLGQVEYMDETTNLITEVIKGDMVKKLYGDKIRLTPNMAGEKFPYKGKNQEMSDPTQPHP